MQIRLTVGAAPGGDRRDTAPYIQAIRAVRTAWGLGLKSGKAAVDSLFDRGPDWTGDSRTFKPLHVEAGSGEAGALALVRSWISAGLLAEHVPRCPHCGGTLAGWVPLTHAELDAFQVSA